MAVKKSELYSSIWKSCDELRGGMDASQYKDYVLILLFVKYVSDKYGGKLYASIKVPEGGSFADMQAAKGKPDIGECLNTIIAKLADVNNLMGVINTADFDDKTKLGDGDEMKERLTNLIAIFENPALDFSRNRAEGDDLLGDAYEYLMRNFATQSGKSKGQFYTPAEVSRIMAKIIGLHTVTSSDQTIYDPTCGSGSLLLKAADEIPPAVGSITLYGQEKDNSTRALAKMNMILHGYATAKIEQGNTLSNPLFKANNGQLQQFDFAVANPPFSDKAWITGIKPEEDVYRRFVDGIPPAKNGDYAFLQHFIRSLKSTGKGAIILPHGVLFRGNVEADIRKSIVEKGYIKGIIGLPANLFYGTGIPACIIVIDKENAHTRRGIFMIDASKGFLKDGNKNRLRYQDIHKIVDFFNNQIGDDPHYARMVPFEEIERNDYNLNIPRYIDTTEPEDIQDIEAHLLGGIPNRDLDALENYWQVLPSVAEVLFSPSGREGYSELKVAPSAIKTTIFEHPEFIAYGERVKAAYTAWRTYNMPLLKGIQPSDQPKHLIEHIAEDVLKRFEGIPLIDKYDIYQHLMTYWAEVMQDDVYILVADGWLQANKIPEFAEGMRRIRQLEEICQALQDEMAAVDAQHGDKGGLLYNGKGKNSYSKRTIENRLKKIRGSRADSSEFEMLTQFLNLMDTETTHRKDIEGIWGKLSPLVEQTLIPPDLIIQRYFPQKQAAIQALQAELEALTQEMTELDEEHSGEDGLLAYARTDAGKITKTTLTARLKALDPDEAEELAVLTQYQNLMDKESDLKGKLKQAETDLHMAVIDAYPHLSEDDLKVLVVEDKWLAALEADVQSELDRVSQALTGRIKQLAERYATPLPELEARAETYRQRVAEHLKKMGYDV